MSFVILILTLKNGVRHRSLRRRTFMVVGKGTHQMANGGGVPPKEIFSEFFWLFEPRTEGSLSDSSFESVMELRGTRELSFSRFMQLEPEFDSYEDFIDYLEEALR